MAKLSRILRMVSEIKGLYDVESTGFNVLVIGKSGVGKTRLAVTCRKPLYLLSFDPGGTRTRALQPYIKDGSIIPDTRCETDDRRAPQAWKTFENIMVEIEASGILEHLGTFFVDSLSSMGECLMNFILSSSGRTNGIPQQQDYLKQQFTLVNFIKAAMKYPCDVIFTGHIHPQKDELLGSIENHLFVTGKLIVKIPLLFDELYVGIATPKANGVDYSLLTTTDGKNQARTRIGGEGVFKQFEEPNIKNLLHKAGLNAKNKPKLSTLEEDE